MSYIHIPFYILTSTSRPQYHYNAITDARKNMQSEDAIKETIIKVTIYECAKAPLVLSHLHDDSTTGLYLTELSVSTPELAALASQCQETLLLLVALTWNRNETIEAWAGRRKNAMALKELRLSGKSGASSTPIRIRFPQGMNHNPCYRWFETR